MVKFPEGIPSPHSARQSLETTPFSYTEPAPFMHLYHADFDGQALIDAVEVDGENTNWGMGVVGSKGHSRYSKHRDSRSKNLFNEVEKSFKNSDSDSFTELQKAAYDVLYHAERAVWNYRLTYGLDYIRESQGWVINKYGHGGQYKVHTDQGTGDPRLISCVIYLNTVEDGADTVFPFQNAVSKCIAGNILVFPSSYIYAHASTPTGSNSEEVKYGMAGFFI